MVHKVAELWRGMSQPWRVARPEIAGVFASHALPQEGKIALNTRGLRQKPGR
jgi:hypothetical protein